MDFFSSSFYYINDYFTILFSSFKQKPISHHRVHAKMKNSSKNGNKLLGNFKEFQDILGHFFFHSKIHPMCIDSSLCPSLSPSGVKKSSESKMEPFFTKKKK